MLAARIRHLRRAYEGRQEALSDALTQEQTRSRKLEKRVKKIQREQLNSLTVTVNARSLPPPRPPDAPSEQSTDRSACSDSGTAPTLGADTSPAAPPLLSVSRGILFRLLGGGGGSGGGTTRIRTCAGPPAAAAALSARPGGSAARPHQGDVVSFRLSSTLQSLLGSTMNACRSHANPSHSGAPPAAMGRVRHAAAPPASSEPHLPVPRAAAPTLPSIEEASEGAEREHSARQSAPQMAAEGAPWSTLSNMWHNVLPWWSDETTLRETGGSTASGGVEASTASPAMPGGRARDGAGATVNAAVLSGSAMLVASEGQAAAAASTQHEADGAGCSAASHAATLGSIATTVDPQDTFGC